MTTGSTKIFRYLIKSVETFLSPDEFTDLLKKAGFENVKHTLRSEAGESWGCIRSLHKNQLNNYGHQIDKIKTNRKESLADIKSS